jgi:hypothetical protein
VSRIVVVLGREPVLDADAVVKQAWKENAELVILTLGWLPLSEGQKRICEVALEAAGRGLIWLEERIMYDPAEVADLLRDDDRVHLAVSSLELKRIETAGLTELDIPRGQLGR